MKIKKLGHSCFVVEAKAGIRVMTDPGAFSTLQNEEKNISAILITHEHQDHFNIDSLKKVFGNNPEAIVITQTAIGKILDEAGIKYTKIEDGQSYDLGGVKILGFGDMHAEIYGTYGRVQNTGYMIGSLCYPGDSFAKPNVQVDILALPVAAPWLKLKDAIDYAKDIKPRVVFSVHDAILSEFASYVPRIVGQFMDESGIELRKMEIGKEEDL